jgi:outer membrane protein assembly factor BamB
MSFNNQKKHARVLSRQLLFLFAFLLVCLTSACSPSPLTSAHTSISTSQAGGQNACPTSANSIYTVQGQILYTVLSVYQHTPQPGENIHTIPHRISLVAFNINNGQKLWSSTLAENVPYFPNIIHIVGVINHTMYVDAGILIAADTRDGHALWQHQENVHFGTYICAGMLYQINGEGQIIALVLSNPTPLPRCLFRVHQYRYQGNRI